jgi:hypothetical protein
MDLTSLSLIMIRRPAVEGEKDKATAGSMGKCPRWRRTQSLDRKFFYLSAAPHTHSNQQDSIIGALTLFALSLILCQPNFALAPARMLNSIHVKPVEYNAPSHPKSNASASLFDSISVRVTNLATHMLNKITRKNRGPPPPTWPHRQQPEPSFTGTLHSRIACIS